MGENWQRQAPTDLRFVPVVERTHCELCGRVYSLLREPGVSWAVRTYVPETGVENVAVFAGYDQAREAYQSLCELICEEAA